MHVDDDELLTLHEVAIRLKVSVETARKLCVTGKLPWVPAGAGDARQTRRVRRSTLNAYIGNERRSCVKEEMASIKLSYAGTKDCEEYW